MKKQNFCIAGLLFLAVSLVGCAGKQTPPEGAKLVQFKGPALGTKVVYKVVNNGEEKTVNETISDMEVEGVAYYYWKDEDSKKSVNLFEKDSSNWRGLWSLENNRWDEKASPNIGTYRFPLWAGKSYRASYRFFQRDGWSGQVDSWVKVGDWETITVPAGTFDVLPITQKNSYFKAERWYSPELGMNVKFSRQSKKLGKKDVELISVTLP